ncbi:MAG: hypothetical protein AAF270_07845 [Pseudomonadota bacterium]
MCAEHWFSASDSGIEADAIERCGDSTGLAIIVIEGAQQRVAYTYTIQRRHANAHVPGLGQRAGKTL